MLSNPFSSLLLSLILYSFLPLATLNPITQYANFQQIQTGKIKSGDNKAVLSTLLSTDPPRTYTQPFFETFSSVPNVAIGIVILNVGTGTYLDYTVTIPSSNITNKDFVSIIDPGTDTTIYQLLYTYIGIASSGVYGKFTQYQWNNISGFPLTSGQLYDNINQPTDSSKTYVVEAFLKDFRLKKQNQDFSIKITANINSSTQITVIVSTNCTVERISFYVFVFDKTTFEFNQTFFIDQGFYYGDSNGTKALDMGLPLGFINYYNMFRGANLLAFDVSISGSIFSIQFDKLPIGSVSKYKYGNQSILHWRQRKCPNASYYYIQSTFQCYSSCPKGYAADDTNKYCKQCQVGCDLCSLSGVCNSCSNDTFKELSNGQCVCKVGYFDTGNPICQTCDYTCKTCVGNKTNCQSCDNSSYRAINNSTHSCPCIQRYFDPSTNSSTSSQCQPCHYSCLSCLNNNSNCITCNSSANRIHISSTNQCFCKSGYYQANPNLTQQECLFSVNITCNSTCLSCSLTRNNCTGCDETNNNRQLNSNNQCVCKTGYYSFNSQVKCIQICGDGKLYEYQCDDGNTVNGDGCSSTCTKQSGFDCNTTDKTKPSICIYQSSYNIQLLNIEKRQSSNIVDLSFKITPALPAESQAKLSNFDNVILSQNIDGNYLNLTVEYKKSVPPKLLASLSISTIPNQLNFQLKSNNNLALNYYSTQTYSLAKVQIVFVYLFIVLTWIYVILMLILYRSSILYITEYMMLVGMVYVGVAGFDAYYIYYYPLTILKYIFGYNAHINGQYGLFANINYGLILLLIPVLVFMALLYLSKKFPTLAMQQLTKKYLLFEITYAFLCFYSIAVMCGLTTSSQSNDLKNVISITSIIFGIIYFAFIALFTAYIFLKQEMGHYFKAEMILNKGAYYYMIVTLLAKLVCVLIYMLVSLINSNIKIAPIILIVFSLATIISTIILKPYLNNLRVVINQTFTLVIFSCYLLIRQVETAQWSGILVIVLLYIWLALSWFMGMKEWYKKRQEAKFIQNQQTNTNVYTSRSRNQGEVVTFNGNYNSNNTNNHQNDNEIPNDIKLTKKNSRLDLDYDPRPHYNLPETQKKQYIRDIKPEEYSEIENRMETVKKNQEIVNPYASNYKRDYNNGPLSTRRKFIHQQFQ